MSAITQLRLERTFLGALKELYRSDFCVAAVNADRAI
jgi:hypothetical protein